MAECIFDQGYMTDEYLTPDYFGGCIPLLLGRQRYVFGELSERAGGIGGLNISMKSIDFRAVDFICQY